MLGALNDIKVGLNLNINGEPYEVLTANFVRMQQRKPVMQTKLRNLITGKVLESTFKPGDRLEEADMARGKANYLYSDEKNVYFMDNKSFEQFFLNKEQLGNKLKFLKEGMDVEVLYFEEKPVNVSLPIKMKLKVISAPPGVKGDTASGNVTKQVTLENNLEVGAPLFIKEGDELIINTETGDYVERA